MECIVCIHGLFPEVNDGGVTVEGVLHVFDRALSETADLVDGPRAVQGCDAPKTP